MCDGLKRKAFVSYRAALWLCCHRRAIYHRRVTIVLFILRRDVVCNKYVPHLRSLTIRRCSDSVITTSAMSGLKSATLNYTSESYSTRSHSWALHT